MDPNNRVSRPKYYTVNGIWALKLYYSGPRTLRVNPKPREPQALRLETFTDPVLRY